MDTNASSLIGFEDKLLSQQPKQTNVYFQQPQYLPVSSMDQLAGLYSNTGFDMVHILSRLMHRPNPQIQLGPIDLSCSFVVSGAKHDYPIIYCSPAFERLTGYTNNEIVGKNCRFLQSPDGQVAVGSTRQHTDNKVVYHLREQLNLGKEHQASIINYKKGGQPFVNLITIVPILGDLGRVDYFVGLQIDLVKQPNSILEKMKDGTYLINYHQPMSNIPSSLDCNNLLMDEYFREVPTNIDRISNGNNVNGLGINPYIMSFLDTSQIGITTHREQIRKEWNKVLLDQCCDFIHVISLKGVFLYVSRSATNMLEYDPQELIGNSLSRLCHPSDIIPVMHEIKEATTHPDKPISLLFRIRRKCSGYMWIDCRGKLHMDQNKGHKCLVLSGRERPVYRLLDNQITKLVGHEEGEYWAKLSLAGLYLYVTPTCKNVIGFTRDSLEHESIYQYIENEAVVDITNALRLVKEGSITKVLHTILDSKGNHVSVLSTFYPGDTLYNEGLPSFLLLQVKRLTHDSNQSAALTNIDTNAIDALLGQNIFGELETFRTTNWQYELYQLQQSNNRLREQLKIYSKPTNSRKRKKAKLSNNLKICAKCQRKDSPEWRKGPNGPKELCNACGLRYAKSLGSNKKEE